MSFVVYDLTFLVLFSLAIGIFLYKKRKKLDKEGIMFLYRTKFGLKIIDYLGKKHPRTMKFLSYIIVFSGYVLMLLMTYFLWQMVALFFKPEFVRLVKIPPLMPIIPYLPEIFKVDWLPPFYFTYWIVALAIVALVHEGAHGIFARFYGVKIKSTGFGFLGPFLAFFVEQDDKQMTKKKIFPQLTILGAGVFANILVGFIFFLLMVGFSVMAYSPAGVMFNDYSYSVGNGSMVKDINFLNQTLVIDGLNLTKIELYNQTYYIPEETRELYSNLTADTPIKFYHDLPAINQAIKGFIVQINEQEIKTYNDINISGQFKPGDNITLVTKEIVGKNKTFHTYNITLGESYQTEGTAALGTVVLQQRRNTIGSWIFKWTNSFREPYTYYEPKYNAELIIFIYNLFWWVVIINISVALSNMLPAFIFDGGRFWYLTVLAITKREKIATGVLRVFTWILLGVLALLMLLWAKGIFFK